MKPVLLQSTCLQCHSNAGICPAYLVRPLLFPTDEWFWPLVATPERNADLTQQRLCRHHIQNLEDTAYAWTSLRNGPSCRLGLAKIGSQNTKQFSFLQSDVKLKSLQSFLPGWRVVHIRTSNWDLPRTSGKRADLKTNGMGKRRSLRCKLGQTLLFLQ